MSCLDLEAAVIRGIQMAKLGAISAAKVAAAERKSSSHADLEWTDTSDGESDEVLIRRVLRLISWFLSFWLTEFLSIDWLIDLLIGFTFSRQFTNYVFLCSPRR